jgi:hypothetical protein
MYEYGSQEGESPQKLSLLTQAAATADCMDCQVSSGQAMFPNSVKIASDMSQFCAATPLGSGRT